MNIIFFGSSQYSTIPLEKLYKKFNLQLIVTKQGPVVDFAKKNNIPFITPEKFNEETIKVITENKPDFIVVADYGLIIPKRILELPRYSSLNVHHSLLPKYRGPTPAPAAILANEKITGVTIIKMAKRVDTGDILAQKEYIIKQDETTDSLLKTLNIIGAEILIPVLENFSEINNYALKQDEKLATYTPKLTRESGYIEISSLQFQISNGKSGDHLLEIGNWKLEIDRKIRAYYLWPGVWTIFRIKNKELRIKLLPFSTFPTVLNKINSEDANTRENNNLNILLQVEGKKPMTIKDFLNGYPEGKELLIKLGLLL